MKKYIRTERTNLFEPNAYISMVVALEGDVSKDDMHRAVEAAYQANETTMSKIVLEANGDAYYEKMEKSGCRLIFDNRNWETIIRDSEKTPFAIREGELVRTYVIAKKEQTVLLIHAHHLAGDGNSILILVKDIINSLLGKTLTYKPMLLIDKEYLAKRAKLLLPAKLFVKDSNNKWEKAGRAFTWEDYDKIHKRYWEKHVSTIEVETYSAAKMKKRCKNGVTLNSYLITKLLKKHSDSRVVGIPISIRDKNEAMSNQTSGIQLKYQYRSGISFEDNLKRIHGKIQMDLKDENMKYFVLLFLEQVNPTLLDSVLLQVHGCYQNPLSQKLAEAMGYGEKKGRDLGVTNLGTIEIPCDFLKLQIKDILFIPPKVSYAKKVVGICTYGDKLHVCYHNVSKKEEG